MRPLVARLGRYYFSPIAAALPHVRDGTLSALAV